SLPSRRSSDLEEAADDGCRLFPMAGLDPERATSSACQPVEARLAVLLGGAPLGRDRALLLELQQYRIQTPLIHGKKISADLLDAPGDTIAMERSQHIERLEDHQRQGALPNVGLFLHCRHPLGFQQES